MCKTHLLYKPRKMTKEQQEYYEKQDLKYLIVAMVMVLIGAVIVTYIFKLMEDGLGI